MSVPARRRPGSASPLLPSVESIKTTPHVEDTQPQAARETPVVAVPAAATPQVNASDATVAQVASTPAPVAAAPTQPATPPPAVAVPAQPVASQAPMSPHGDYPAELDEKKPSTVAIRRILKARAETAVLRTAGLEGGYTSWNAFVEGALERELQRMAEQFNNGEPFPPNGGAFRQGRPLGS